MRNPSSGNNSSSIDAHGYGNQVTLSSDHESNTASATPHQPPFLTAFQTPPNSQNHLLYTAPTLYQLARQQVPRDHRSSSNTPQNLPTQTNNLSLSTILSTDEEISEIVLESSQSHIDVSLEGALSVDPRAQTRVPDGASDDRLNDSDVFLRGGAEGAGAGRDGFGVGISRIRFQTGQAQTDSSSWNHHQQPIGRLSVPLPTGAASPSSPPARRWDVSQGIQDEAEQNAEVRQAEEALRIAEEAERQHLMSMYGSEGLASIRGEEISSRFVGEGGEGEGEAEMTSFISDRTAPPLSPRSIAGACRIHLGLECYHGWFGEEYSYIEYEESSDPNSRRQEDGKDGAGAKKRRLYRFNKGGKMEDGKEAKEEANVEWKAVRRTGGPRTALPGPKESEVIRRRAMMDAVMKKNAQRLQRASTVLTRRDESKTEPCSSSSTREAAKSSKYPSPSIGEKKTAIGLFPDISNMPSMNEEEKGSSAPSASTQAQLAKKKGLRDLKYRFEDSSMDESNSSIPNLSESSQVSLPRGTLTKELTSESLGKNDRRGTMRGKRSSSTEAGIFDLRAFRRERRAMRQVEMQSKLTTSTILKALSLQLEKSKRNEWRFYERQICSDRKASSSLPFRFSVPGSREGGQSGE
ncbi:hypothetical protein IE53DRAFT_157849 [Violaceomyces palustris]|uniref:Uncharacterized protein n=1 Tax=Violaceomyces palustris TaxID=1673888 RepID=A0ACD0P8P7_9BASI|nr:hypothetical protein IE53DRAFT_157849 [Violaceomyces palustris]